MAVNKKKVAIIAIVMLLLCLGIWPMLGHPSIFTVRTAIDVNTGDIKAETTLLGIRVSEEIHSTRFSTEVRRLNVQIPKEPIWRYMYGQGLTGKQFTFDYCQARAKCGLLMDFLDSSKTPDDERRVILSAVLQSLQRGQISEIDKQIDILGALTCEVQHGIMGTE